MVCEIVTWELNNKFVTFILKQGETIEFSNIIDVQIWEKNVPTKGDNHKI